MTCEEIQKSFTPYLDDQLPLALRAVCDDHFESCLVCRARLTETRLIIRGLANLDRPAPPAHLVSTINRALVIERAARRAEPSVGIGESIARWLRPRVMPYTIGALATMVLFFAISTALLPKLHMLSQLARAARASEITLEHPAGFEVAPTLTAESPSLNPRGALAALAWTPPRGGEDDDDMIVVADVFSNGSASLAGVVRPPRNPRLLGELQAALRRNPAFVPASYDQRPQTMRVVFVLQKVNVQERSF